MRSVTSYFNPTLYKKNFTSYWPLWGLYLFCGLCLTSFRLIQEHIDNASPTYILYLAESLPEMMPALVLIASAYCVMCAAAVYNYLFQARAACGIHALPMKRDTVFLTNYLCGTSFFVLPNLIITIVTMLTEAVLIDSSHWETSLPRVLLICVVLTGVEIFFFSFATLCSMFTGHVLALPILYGIFNFLVIGLYTIIVFWSSVLLYGVQFHSYPEFVTFCTPIVNLYNACDDYLMLDGVYTLHSPATIAVYAGIGILLSVLALVLYRCRHIESAGDIIAFPSLYPIFRIGVSVCSGLSGGSLMMLFFNSSQRSFLFSTFSILLWATIGYFAAEMLLQKSFRVFSCWKGCIVVLAGCVATNAFFYADILGIQTHVPDADDVVCVDLYIPTYPSSTGTFSLTDQASISKVIQIHETVVANIDTYGKLSPYDDPSADNWAFLNLNYTLKNGTTLSRYYPFPMYYEELNEPTTATAQLEALVSDRNVQWQGRRMDAFNELQIVGGEAYYDYTPDSYELSQADAKLVWAALLQDFDEGNIFQISVFPQYEQAYETPAFEERTETVPDDSNAFTVTEPVPSTDTDTIPWNNQNITRNDTIYLTLGFLKKIDLSSDSNTKSYRIFDCEIGSNFVNTLAALRAIGPDYFQ